MLGSTVRRSQWHASKVFGRNAQHRRPRFVTVGKRLWGAGAITSCEDEQTAHAAFDEEWMYATFEQAVAAFKAWDGEGEPEGWIRHTPSNRRRPDGDPSQETVRR